MSRFFKTGLRFSCQLCGMCCRLPNGSVNVSKDEARKISNYLNLAYKDFLGEYCINNDAVIKIKESPNDACVFLNGDKCQIYEVRPLQCQTFPFWPENLKSRFRWKQLKFFCSGIDEGELYSPRRIKEIFQLQKMHDTMFGNEGEDIEI